MDIRFSSAGMPARSKEWTNIKSSQSKSEDNKLTAASLRDAARIESYDNSEPANTSGSASEQKPDWQEVFKKLREERVMRQLEIDRQVDLRKEQRKSLEDIIAKREEVKAEILRKQMEQAAEMQLARAIISRIMKGRRVSMQDRELVRKYYPGMLRKAEQVNVEREGIKNKVEKASSKEEALRAVGAEKREAFQPDIGEANSLYLRMIKLSQTKPSEQEEQKNQKQQERRTGVSIRI